MRLAEVFPAQITPAAKLWVNFCNGIGEKKSSALITVHYTLAGLVGKRVMTVVHFPPRQIGPVKSEVLVLGVPDEDGAVILISPDSNVPLGVRLF